MPSASKLFDVQGVPIIQVTLWSRKLNAWVYLVPEKRGCPSGTYEVTPQEIERMDRLIQDGWGEADAIFRTLGVRTEEGI